MARKPKAGTKPATNGVNVEEMKKRLNITASNSEIKALAKLIVAAEKAQEFNEYRKQLLLNAKIVPNHKGTPLK